ncbi:Protein MEC-2 c [Aphelenchoides avenae]|nr:Protein MEC-2 c [Aphelenchus avenae]
MQHLEPFPITSSVARDVRNALAAGRAASLGGMMPALQEHSVYDITASAAGSSNLGGSGAAQQRPSVSSALVKAAPSRRFSLLPSMPHSARWKSHAHKHGWKTVHDTTFFADQPVTGNLGFCGLILTIISYIVILITLPISAFFCVKILSKDSVTVAVDVVVYFRIANATISVTNVEDSSRSTKLLAQTTLRNILGTKTLAEMLSDREQIALQIQETLDEATYPWGVKVERVEVKDVRLPVQLQRAMAAEAEASREARAKVIAAEGEQLASRALSEAANVLSESPSAIHLSLLQTLNTVSAEKNQTIIVPIPVELVRALMNRNKSPASSYHSAQSTLRAPSADAQLI